MKIGVYAGSFDPVTRGHNDIIQRSSKIFDKVIVAVLTNVNKKPLFTMEEKIALLKESTKNYSNVEVKSFDGLLTDFAKKENANAIIRGLRAVTDFEYELSLAQTNRVLCPDIDTVFLVTSLEYAYLSSSIVKEVASYKGNISAFVEPFVEEKIKEKYKY